MSRLERGCKWLGLCFVALDKHYPALPLKPPRKLEFHPYYYTQTCLKRVRGAREAVNILLCLNFGDLNNNVISHEFTARKAVGIERRNGGPFQAALQFQIQRSHFVGEV